MSGETEDDIYGAVENLALDMHDLVARLAIYPPEVIALVIRNALKDTPIKGKRKRRLTGFVINEAKARREAKAHGDPVPFEEPAEPAQEAA